MTPKQLHRHGQALLAAVTAALELPEERLPRFPRTRREDPSEGAKERLKRLKSWRERSSAALRLEPGVVSPNWLLEAVADMNPASPADLDGIAGMREWQKGLCGRELIEVLEADGK